MTFYRLPFVAILFVISNLARAIQPVPDPSFGTGGTAILTHGDLGGVVDSVAIQRDGKPVIGYANIIPVGRFLGSQGFWARLNPDGNVDASLLGSPIAYEPPKVLIQRDGQILVTKSYVSPLARYLADGRLDEAFTSNAKVALEGLPNLADVALQADGKVLVFGSATILEVVRLNTDGTVDTSFGMAGYVSLGAVGATNGYDSAVGIVALPQGKIAVAINHFRQTVRPGVVRLTADGMLDLSFGVNGEVTLGDDMVGYAIAVQSDGKLLLASAAPILLVKITRITNAGTVDSGFGTFGEVARPGQPNFYLVVQSDDQFLLATNAPAQITRYAKNGSLDTTFGEEGSVSPESLRSINAAALGPDGSIWIAGMSTQPAPLPYAAAGNPAVVHYIGGSTAAIEYYNAGLDHYFLSANPQETKALDLGTFQGWARTILSFNVFEASGFAVDGSVPVCRFYIPPPFGDSHFFSASPAECAEVTVRFQQFVLETSEAMRVGLPDAVTGMCPPATPVAVYRVWNARPDTNHRYTTSKVVRDFMVSQGWVAEGYGPDAVAMCALAR